MSNRPMSLQEFLEQRHLIHSDNSASLTKARKRIEQSRLLEILQDICTEINRKAQTVVVEAQSYLPPEQLVRSFSFINGRSEYVMQIEVWGPKPTLTFLVRKWRDTSPNPLIRWVCRLAQLEPMKVSVKFSSLIDDENVTRSHVEQWFFYLVSGLSHEFTPSGAVLGYSVSRPSEEGQNVLDRTAAAAG